jgi:hypothetical protein
VRALRARRARDEELTERAQRLEGVIEHAGAGVRDLHAALERELAADRLAGEQSAGELTAFAAREADIQSRLKEAGGAVTAAEVAAQRSRDRTAEAQAELAQVLQRLARPSPAPSRTPPARPRRSRSPRRRWPS